MTSERFQKLVAILKRRQPDLTILMDDVHKTHNLAAVTRTCDAVGIPEIHAVTTQKILFLKKNVASGCNKWVVSIHCQRRRIPYPELNADGEIMGELALRMTRNS